MWKIAVCEDEREPCLYFGEKIEQAFRNRKCQVKMDLFCQPGKLLEQSRYNRWNVCFLDIEMPGIDGISLARELKQRDSYMDILFLSNREELVFQSLTVSPLRFIRKNCFAAEIYEAVDAILKIHRERQVLSLEIGGKLFSLPVNSVFYIESLGRMQIVHTEKENYEVYRKIGDFEQFLSQYGFLRTHKSYLVNYQYIYSIEQKSVFLDDGTEIPLSKHRISEIKQEYRRLIQRKR